jgi:mitochondrial protein import protein ZIM17
MYASRMQFQARDCVRRVSTWRRTRYWQLQLDALSRKARQDEKLHLFTITSLVMLPSRLLRHWAASSQISRLRRPLAHSSIPWSRLSWTVRHNSTGVPPPPAPGSPPSTVTSNSQTTRSAVDEPRLSLTFTCTAGNCSTRSTHQFTKRAYERGIVLIECPGCKTRYVLLANVAVVYNNPATLMTIS